MRRKVFSAFGRHAQPGEDRIGPVQIRIRAVAIKHAPG